MSQDRLRLVPTRRSIDLPNWPADGIQCPPSPSSVAIISTTSCSSCELIVPIVPIPMRQRRTWDVATPVASEKSRTEQGTSMMMLPLRGAAVLAEPCARQTRAAATGVPRHRPCHACGPTGACGSAAERPAHWPFRPSPFWPCYRPRRHRSSSCGGVHLVWPRWNRPTWPRRRT